DSMLMATPTIEISTKVVKLAAGAAVPPPTPTPTLTLTGPLGFTAGAASGTLLANIGNVPTGVTPTLTPNDGRLAIAGDDTNGWKVVVGLSASAAGTINLTVSAAGAIAASAGVAVAASIYITIPNYATMAVAGDSFGVGVGATTTANGWAYLLAAALGALLANSSVSGSVLQHSADAGGSARPSNLRDNYGTYLLGSNKKAAAFIALGYNDARYIGANGTFNVAQYISDYREIINGLILGGYARADIYIISPWYITDLGLTTGSTGFAGQTRAAFVPFVTGAASVAAEFGVNYTDAYNPLNIAAYIADVDGNDRVHPRNVGHNIIFTTVRDKTIAANTRAAPTVTSSVANQTVTVVASAVAGAVSYEYELIANPVRTAGNTSGTFTGVAAGSYYGKARAIFSDGIPGPWGFTAAAVTVAAAGNSLNTLTLSGAPKNGTASTGTINGATAGSSIVSNVSGLTVDSAARTYAFDGTAAAATTTNGLVETLGGATGSPKSSPVTVAAASARTARGVTESYGSTADGTLLTATSPTLGTWAKNGYSTGDATIMANAITGGPTASRIAVEHLASATYANGQYAKGTMVVRSDAAPNLSVALVLRSDPANQTFLGILYNGGNARVVKYTNGTLGLIGTPIASALGVGTYAVDIQATPANAGADCVISGTINGVAFSYTVAESSLPALGTGMGIRTQTAGVVWTSTTGPVFTSIEVGSVN
ncbi:GDSL-type esterase/lipase family protein, partial [Sphingomonas sp. PP-CC-3A-396]|uniref:GDSL-type esterase/lipase family protein n=1 Tax=Sphingomonas sp. PP-CC-3A-396 TaxID=2135655 RepID=UPI0010437F60